MNAKNVSAAKPKVGGAAYYAPSGTTLPTDATTALDATFASLGYLSEDGLTNTPTIDSEELKAWGGDVVLPLQTGKSDHFSFTMLESLSEDVLKTYYGDSNVSGTLATGIAVAANALEHDEKSWAFEMVMRGGVLKRVVVPFGTVMEVGEVTYVDNGAVMYQVTLYTRPDSSGNTHYEYMIKQ